MLSIGYAMFNEEGVMSENALKSMTVGEFLDRWPETVSVFNRNGMACPGCAMAPFMTIAEACAAYKTDAAKFMTILRREIESAALPREEKRK